MTTESFDPETYLRDTYWCDTSHPMVRALAAQLTRNARTSREAAAALFDWMCGVAIALAPANRRASETIELRAGTRANQANALVALARAIGIPGAFRVPPRRDAGARRRDPGLRGALRRGQLAARRRRRGPRW